MRRSITVGGLISVAGPCASAAVTTYVWDGNPGGRVLSNAYTAVSNLAFN